MRSGTRKYKSILSWGKENIIIIQSSKQHTEKDTIDYRNVSIQQKIP